MSKKLFGLTAFVTGLILGVSALANETAAEHFSIKSQSLASALRAYADQTGYQVVFFSEVGKNQKSSDVEGNYTSEEALRKLLEKTGLTFERLKPKTVAITSAKMSNASAAGAPISLAQADTAQSGSEGNPPVSADDGEKAGKNLEEIVVTAQKREQQISDVPISISAYSPEEMDRRAIREMSDIAAITPGLSFSTDGTINKVTIRGIMQNVGTGTAGTTAIYIDDVPVQTRSGIGGYASTSPKIFDLERVEVLRGPQGTLFGASAMGGAIRFITPQPSLTDYSGYVRGEVTDTRGGELSNEAGVAVGGPIIEDKLGFRVSAWHRRDGGYIDNYGTLPGGAREENSNNSDTYAVRGALAFAPTDNLTITAAMYVHDLNSHDLSRFEPDLSDASDSRLLENRSLLEPIRDKFYLPSLRIEADLGIASLTSVSTYIDRHFVAGLDYTDFLPWLFGGAPPTSASQFNLGGITTDQSIFTQEMRLSSRDLTARLQWTLGGFYSLARQSGLQWIESPSFPQFILDTFGLPIEDVFGTGLADGKYSFFANQRFRDEELAGFGNLEYELVGGLSVTAGVRISQLKNEVRFRGEGPFYGGLSTNGGTQKETPITPKFGINYKPNTDNLFYASISKGFRGGNTNPPVLSTTDACRADIARFTSDGTLTYDSDSLWSYEVGTKNELLDGRLRVSASAFHIKWANIQQNVFLGSCGLGFVANLGEANSDGFDLVLDARLTDKLTAYLAMGYTDAEYTETATIAGATFVREGDQVGDISPRTITAALQYNFDLLPSAGGYIRVENRYNSRNNGRLPFQNPENQTYDPCLQPDEARNELIVRAGTTWGRVDVSAFATNVLNAHPLYTIKSVGSSCGRLLPGAQTIRPFTVGLTGIYRW